MSALQDDASAAPTTAARRRKEFAGPRADALAEQVGAATSARLPSGQGRSPRYVWFSEPDLLTLVVGDQEGDDVDTALAVGLAERGDRALRLVLPLSLIHI